MKIIDQSHEIIDRDSMTPAQLIELCGRTCYKSEDKITDDSAEKFVKMIAKRGHLSVLEHGALAIELSYSTYLAFKNVKHEVTQFLNFSINDTRQVVSGNLRAWLEFLQKTEGTLLLSEMSIGKIKFLIWQYCPVAYEVFLNEALHHRWGDHTDPLIKIIPADAIMDNKERLLHEYKTVRFITNRSVTHELVRHRPASYSQESTRYVNYGGSEMQFIKPVWWDKNYPVEKAMLSKMLDYQKGEDLFISACKNDELFYQALLKKGWRPEQAREVLPNALKTEIVVTANLAEWRHIFKLRCSKAAHPQIRELVRGVQADFQERMPEIFGETN